jgi:hypothetical protein
MPNLDRRDININAELIFTFRSDPLTLPLSPRRGEGGGEGSISKDLTRLY